MGRIIRCVKLVFSGNGPKNAEHADQRTRIRLAPAILNCSIKTLEPPGAAPGGAVGVLFLITGDLRILAATVDYDAAFDGEPSSQ